MKVRSSIAVLAALIVGALLLAGCGGSSSSSAPASTAAPSAAGQNQGAPARTPEAGPPSEAESAATGDIPDNQVFLQFRDPKAGYSIRYPEGWARRGSGSDVTFREKANVIHVVVKPGPAPSEASARAGVEALAKSDPTIKVKAAESLSLGGATARKVTYSRMSAPDPVTGKRLPLVIDRYEYGHGGKVAVADLATPVGVDNVDAYRMISESFRWLP